MYLSIEKAYDAQEILWLSHIFINIEVMGFGPGLMVKTNN
jgi:hypothetical protein